MASWPSTLPRPDAPGYGIKPLDSTIRTDMDVGSARVRRRTMANNDMVTLSWYFTDVQLQTFRTWHASSTGAAGGAAWFTIDLALGTLGMVSSTARFKGPFQVAHLSGLTWTVSAELEVR